MTTENATLVSTHKQDIQNLTTQKDNTINEWDGTIADMKKLLSQRDKDIQDQKKQNDQMRSTLSDKEKSALSEG